MTIHWQWKFFSELDKNALYDILALRQKVFMLEQLILRHSGRNPGMSKK